MNTPIINVSKRDLGRKFIKIGEGSEGKVYNYDNKYAIKIFTDFDPKRYSSKMRLQKIEDMSKMRIGGVSLPLGLAIVDGQICGCFTRLVDFIEGRKDFNALDAITNTRRLLTYILKAEDIMIRLHDKGIALGDIRRDNIMINRNDEPVYIDTDNYIFDNYHFDRVPDRATSLYSIYGGPVRAFIDNDILVFTIMALRILTKDPKFEFSSTKEELRNALNKLKFKKQEKEVIDAIFSDSTSKPYFGSIL